ncbi:MAG: DUF3078 domain-containing protein [Bacteroidales bacterium]|jgi:hypothetical protein|nr:DUF3078 domain-containing protein [Bacteroidales bacterium]
MKRILLTLSLLAAATVAWGQNTQEAAAAAAAALSAAEDVPVKEEKPKYWTNTFNANLNFGQTYLSQWVAGGFNNISVTANVDAVAKFAKGKALGNSRIQLEYGQLYSADKPIFQKTKDRIYLESKWGYQTSVKNLAYSASIDFKTQFGKNYTYGTPKEYQGDEPTREDWLIARTLKSGFLAPAYLNIGVGALWTPAPWISINVAPLSGGGVLVTIPELRKTYGMDFREGSETEYTNFRAEFGAQIKVDMAWVVNDVFSYSTQVTAFYNYLTPKMEPRITWDNKISWKVVKFFAINLSTNLIYDPRVLVRDTDKTTPGLEAKGVQFKEYCELGFTYTITRKH